MASFQFSDRTKMKFRFLLVALIAVLSLFSFLYLDMQSPEKQEIGMNTLMDTFNHPEEVVVRLLLKAMKSIFGYN
ncbi:MAG: hypothetical protein IPG18_14660 [Saprospiraceae bacterium]|nr:hypothetical protein [Saprospiraceae bacterium]MBK7524327.1 hypothetical protein [Saprospiraceae bacterium]